MPESVPSSQIPERYGPPDLERLGRKILFWALPSVGATTVSLPVFSEMSLDNVNQGFQKLFSQLDLALPGSPAMSQIWAPVSDLSSRTVETALSGAISRLARRVP